MKATIVINKTGDYGLLSIEGQLTNARFSNRDLYELALQMIRNNAATIVVDSKTIIAYRVHYESN